MKQAKKRILFFIMGATPTAADLETVEALGQPVMYRNAGFVPAEGTPEECDFVAGAVPALYSEFPKATPVGKEPEAPVTQPAPVIVPEPAAPVIEAPAPAAEPAAPVLAPTVDGWGNPAAATGWTLLSAPDENNAE